MFALWGAPAPPDPRVGGLPPPKLPRGVWGAATLQPGGTGGREPPMERKAI